MDEVSNQQSWPALEKDDEGLLKEIHKLLTARALGNPYGRDGSFAANIALLPPGLRAMAATHWLDISLAIDGITRHFGNFGEPHLVDETEAGLHELGLHELASCFVEAKELMVPLVAQRTKADGDLHEILERAGLETRAYELDQRASAHHRFLLGVQLHRFRAVERDLEIVEQRIQEKLKPYAGEVTSLDRVWIRRWPERSLPNWEWT